MSADRELVLKALRDVPTGRWAAGQMADAVLAALAEAGRLRDSGDGEEWTVQRSGFTWPPLAHREDAEREHRVLRGAVLVRRWVGPWLPVPPDTEEKP